MCGKLFFQNKYIYVVEYGILMNGCEYEYGNVYYSSTFELAKQYVYKQIDMNHSFYHEDEDEDEEGFLKKPEIKQINDHYWRADDDYGEYRYGILKQRLNKPFN